MELSNTGIQQKLHIEGIKEINKTPQRAAEITKKDGLDEVYFTAGDKSYVAFGKGMETSKFKAKEGITFEGSKAEINSTDNEVNSAKDGAKKALKSVIGVLGIGAGTVAAGTLGLGMTAFSMFGGSAAITTGFAIGGGVFTLAGAAAGGALVAGGGAIYGAIKAKDGNYEALNSVTK